MALELCVKCLKCMRRLKRKNIKRLKRFRPQASQASSLKADPDFRQDDGYGATEITLSAGGRIRQDDDSRAVIPDLIRNLCYWQKTQILTFVRMTATGMIPARRIR